MSVSKFLQTIATLLVLIIVAACTQTQNTVETTLSPQPTATQQTASAGSAQSVEANALAQTQQPSASQTVTEAQTSTDASATTEQPAQVAALDTTNAMTFLPVEGAPTNAVTKLSKSLRQSAQNKGLSLLSPTQAGAKYRVKGYFSALNDGSGTLLVYVWDVLDSSGKRVHRINGQERSGTSETNPWLAITDNELNRVADRTTSSLKSWVDNRKS